MSVTLEGIDITGLVFEEDFNTKLIGVTQVANDGSLIVYEQSVGFMDLILIGGDDWGWLTRETMRSLRDLASASGSVYQLDYDGEIYTVRFKSEDIPVISGNSLIKRSNAEDTDYYNNIVLKLMEV